MPYRYHNGRSRIFNQLFGSVVNFLSKLAIVLIGDNAAARYSEKFSYRLPKWIRSSGPRTTVVPEINSRLACLPLALFVCVHPARYVKGLAVRLSVVAELEVQRIRGNKPISSIKP
jgi:hypothetical protein